MSFAGQKVVVIGGTSNVGLAVAAAAAREGARVVVGSRTRERVKAALHELPDGVEGHEVDVCDEASLGAFFRLVGGFHHLVSTAGDYLLFRSLADVSLEAARGSFDTRYWGAFAAVKGALSYLADGGSVVLTSGMIADRPVANLTASASATAAVESLGKTLAIELGPQLRVNTVRLGPVGRKPEAGHEQQQAETYRSVREKLPLKRMGTADEAAMAYLYLMQNTFATGTVLTVDGGYLLV